MARRPDDTSPCRASPCRLTRWGAVVGAVINRARVRTSVQSSINCSALSHNYRRGQMRFTLVYCLCWHRAGPSSRRPEGRPPVTVTNPRQVGGSRAHDEALQWLRPHPVTDDLHARSTDVSLAPSPRTTKHSFPMPKGPASFHHARRGTRRTRATGCITSPSSTPTKSWPPSHLDVPIGLTSQQRPHGAGISRICAFSCVIATTGSIRPCLVHGTRRSYA